jgi:hypothetical protein
MNDERWSALTTVIEDKFDVEEDYVEELPEKDGGGDKEVIVFSDAKFGKLKIERYIKPLILGKKTYFSKRGNSETAIKYEYSESETTQSIKIFKYDPFKDFWIELDANNVGQILS